VNALIPPHESAIRKKSAQKLTSWSGPQMHPQHNMQLPMQGMGDMHLFYTKQDLHYTWLSSLSD
jgi:hypothetical protein